MENNVHPRLANFGIENQTTVDSLMPLRIMSYDVGSYRQQINDNHTLAKKYQKRNYPVKMLSSVISIVLNFSDKRWNTSRCLKDMIEIPEEPLIYSDFIQDYKMLVFDIAFLEDEVINNFKSDFGIVARFFKNKRTNNLNDMSVADVKRVKPLLRFFSEMTNQKEFENLEDRLLAEKRKGVRIPMCTFTQGLVDEGIAKEKRATIIRMLNFGLADKDISTLSAVPLSTVQKIKAQLASNTDDELTKIDDF